MASNVILDYAFKVSASSVIPTADTSFLKAVAVVLKPDEACTVSTEGIYTITAKSFCFSPKRTITEHVK